MGAFPFNQNFRFEFPATSSSEFNSIFLREVYPNFRNFFPEVSFPFNLTHNTLSFIPKKKIRGPHEVKEKSFDLGIKFQTHDIRIRSTVRLLTQLRGMTSASLEYLDHPWLPQVLITQSTSHVTWPYCQFLNQSVICSPSSPVPHKNL